MAEWLAAECAWVGKLVADQPGAWDLSGEIPRPLLRELGGRGLLCAQVSGPLGGIGASSGENGELTAYVGGLCSSLRSVMTSQGMAAWTIERLGDAGQRKAFLPRLVSGELAATGFSEAQAGSDLAAMTTEFRRDGDEVVINGDKVWVTAAQYADLLIIFGRYDDGAAAAVVPACAPGVTVERVANPLGCRAAGHAGVRLREVRVPFSSMLGGGPQFLPLLVTTALAYGRISVAWGCVGILRACLRAAAGHASTREQFGVPLGEHQLVARHLANLLTAEQVATRVCEHASRCWEEGSPDMVTAIVVAKQVGAVQAAAGASAAVQVLASAGARDGHVVARAYRDAKLMELIEGSTEICELMLARHSLAALT
jgi:methoxymalonate biosynthesis protein